jgi:hypothetical protein
MNCFFPLHRRVAVHRPGGPSASRPSIGSCKKQVCALQLLCEEYRQRQPRGISLKWLLRVVQAMASEARRGSTLGAPCWREDVCRLGRRHHSDLRSRNGRGPTGLDVRSCISQFLRLCASQTQPGPFQLNRLPRSWPSRSPRVRVS